MMNARDICVIKTISASLHTFPKRQVTVVKQQNKCVECGGSVMCIVVREGKGLPR